MKKLILLLTLVFPLYCFAREIPKQQIDSFLTSIENKNVAMGSVSIYFGSTEVYNNSFGYEDVENSIRASRNTKYRIVSMSKMFTSTVIMHLLENGKLSLDTKLSKFYPNIKNAEKITIEHLLMHRSGILNYERDEWIPITRIGNNPKEKIYRYISNYPSLFEPGSQFNYSNTNYVLLGWIAADVTGKSFETLLQEVVIMPSELKNTYPGGILNRKKNEAVCYLKVGDGNDKWTSRVVEHHDFMLPDGGLVSTPSDIGIFLNKLFKGQLISMSSLNKIKPQVEKGYGYGMQLFSSLQNPIYGHTGGLYSYRSMSIYDPKNDISIVVMQNALEMPPEEIVKTLYDLIMVNSSKQL